MGDAGRSQQAPSALPPLSSKANGVPPRPAPPAQWVMIITHCMHLLPPRFDLAMAYMHYMYMHHMHCMHYMHCMPPRFDSRWRTCITCMSCNANQVRPRDADGVQPLDGSQGGVGQARQEPGHRRWLHCVPAVGTACLASARAGAPTRISMALGPRQRGHSHAGR